MEEGHASRTAEYMALFRALEGLRPPAERLFEDCLAHHFLRPSLALAVRLARLPGFRMLVPWLVDRRVPGARSSAVGRTRFIDDAIGAALAAETEQLVILGAGFDCRATRLPAVRSITVFEVDHPDTLRAKRRTLDRLPAAPRAHVRYVPTDFNRQSLAETMAAAGYQETARTFFLWEGVTNYLTEAAVDATLRWCARAAAGSQVLFTYVHRAVLEHPGTFIGTEQLFASLERFGERWTFGIEPSSLPAFLVQRGLTLERDLGATEYRALYFKTAAQAMRGYEFYRLAVARVGAPAADVR